MRPLLILSVLSLTTVAVADEEKTFDLPEDPGAAVVVMEYKGGFTPPRTSEAPWLTVRADGSVEMPDRFGQGKDFTAKITPEELQALLRDVVAATKFLEIDPKELAKKYEAAMNPKPAPGGVVQPPLRIADAPVTEITVHLKDKTNTVSQYALSMYAGQFKIDEMTRLAAAEKAIKQFTNIVRAGGQEQVEIYLELFNQEVAAESPKAPKLTVKDISFTDIQKDGTIVVNLMKSGAPEKPRNYIRGAAKVKGEDVTIDVSVSWNE